MPKKKVTKNLRIKKKRYGFHKKFFTFVSTGLGVIFLLAACRLLVVYHAGVLGASTSIPEQRGIQAASSFTSQDRNWGMSITQLTRSQAEYVIAYKATLMRESGVNYKTQIVCSFVENNKIVSSLTPSKNNYAYSSVSFTTTFVDITKLHSTLNGVVCSAWYQTSQKIDGNQLFDNPISFNLSKDNIYNNDNTKVYIGALLPTQKKKTSLASSPTPVPLKQLQPTISGTTVVFRWTYDKTNKKGYRLIYWDTNDGIPVNGGHYNVLNITGKPKCGTKPGQTPYYCVVVKDFACGHGVGSKVAKLTDYNPKIGDLNYTPSAQWGTTCKK